MSGILFGEKDGGGVAPVRVDDEGRLETSADAATEELASTVGTGAPLTEDPAVTVALKPGATVATVPGPGQTATATPAPDAEGLLVRTVGDVSLGASLEPAGEGTGLSTSSYQAGEWIVTAQAPPQAPLHVQGVGPGEVAERLATQDAVDELEADADAIRTAVESIDAKTLAPLGTALLAPVRATATSTATQLADVSTPRGFSIDNIDASNPLYLGRDNTLTTSSGIKVEAGYGYEFLLPNTNLIWIITATTADYQIVAVS